MHVIDLLQEIRELWLDRVSRRLARGESVRLSLLEQLNEFYDLLTQALISGDPSWLNKILDKWAEARTQTELDQPEISITPILDHILLATHESVQENFDPAKGLSILGSLLPIYTYAYNYISQQETEIQIKHRSEELNKARINLENLDKSKSDFIAVAAHELKTPLTLIEGYSSMLRDQYPDEDQESLTPIYLKGIDKGVSRLQEIINDMIDVSLIDNNLLKLNFQPIWIKQLLALARNYLERFIHERSQTYEVLDFDGSEQMTFGDPERLYQAIHNLLINAIKYTPDGGSITISGRKLPGFVEITITDTGIGIDQAYHEQIFEKFGRLGNVQLHSSGKTKFKGGGPGLGLPITKGVIEAHGGAIWVESEGYDEQNLPGTTFHVLLPILKEPPDKKLSTFFESLNQREDDQVIQERELSHP
jgi:signal transduction histidine kinase